VVASRARSPRLVFAALLSPLYWVMMSLAGWKALWQLIVAPSFWEKTVHGLSSPQHETISIVDADVDGLSQVSAP
jgi:hypothetical protein